MAVLKNIAITGVSGYIGSRLVERLDRMPEIASIIGTDIRTPLSTSPKLKFFSLDIGQPPQQLLSENRVDTLIHLAFILNPTHQVQKAGKVDIDGTRVLLESCVTSGIKHVIYLSSHTVYGAFPGNTGKLKEDSPLRPLPGFQYSEDKVRCEKLLQDFSAWNPGTKVTVLRTCPVIGRNAGNSISTVMMRQPVVLQLKGYDPEMQFIHEDDLADLVARLVLSPVAGTFNTAGEGVVKYSEIASLAGKRKIVLPEYLIRPLLVLGWKLRLQEQSPAVGLEFINYPPLVDTRGLKAAVGFRFKYTGREAVLAYLKQ